MAITAAHHLSKIMNAKIAGLAGTGRQQTLVMESIKEFPRGISDQAISLRAHDGERERATGPGLKLQAFKLQAASIKPFAASIKRQAASNKLFNFTTLIKFQAASPKQQASSDKPQATSSLIFKPS